VPRSELLATADHLRALAAGTLGEPPIPPGEPARARWAATLTDESGARPVAIGPLLDNLAGVRRAILAAPSDPAEALWRLPFGRGADPLALVLPGPGPLFDPGDSGMETRTERELSAMHALGAHAVGRDSPALWVRLWSAVDWHVRELQPDNATGRPWAVHVFAMRAAGADDAGIASGARLHASTLVHNCRVTLGRPDRVSACILLHASITLRLAADLARFA